MSCERESRERRYVNLPTRWQRCHRILEDYYVEFDQQFHLQTS
jgi:hypothetical protein